MKALIFCDDAEPEKTIPFCRSKNCGIEIQSFYDPEFIKDYPDSINNHRHAIKPIELRALHGPFADLCPGSFDVMIREVTRNRFELAYDIAAQLDICHIILHHGYVPGTSSPRNWLSRFTTFWQTFLEGKSEKVNIHIENMLEYDPILLSDVISAINHPNVDVCLDIGHAHCNSGTPVLEWITHLGNQIGYVHLHDNNGEYDEHLALGEGTMPAEEVCQALLEYAPNAIWAIETQASNIERSYQWLGEHNFLDIPEQ